MKKRRRGPATKKWPRLKKASGPALREQHSERLQ